VPAAGAYISRLLRQQRCALHYEDRCELIGAFVKARETAPDKDGRLPAVAGSLIMSLTASAAWNSTYLNTAPALFNPAAELAEIRQHAAQIRALRAEIGPPPPGTGPEHDHAVEHHRRDLEQLDLIFASLQRRVTALW